MFLNLTCTLYFVFNIDVGYLGWLQKDLAIVKPTEKRLKQVGGNRFKGGLRRQSPKAALFGSVNCRRPKVLRFSSDIAGTVLLR